MNQVSESNESSDESRSVLHGHMAIIQLDSVYTVSTYIPEPEDVHVAMMNLTWLIDWLTTFSRHF